jgi:epoxide hydrolase-like predicted phosphatase
MRFPILPVAPCATARHPAAEHARISHMSSERAVDTVIFDLGGVIMANGGPRDFTRRYPDHDPKVVAEIVMGPHHLDTDHQWHRVERGEITLAECRAITKKMLDDAGIVATVAPPASTSGQAGVFNFALSAPMVEFVHDLKANGLRIGILTNNVREFREMWWPLMDFAGVFDTIVDSHEVAMRKPNPQIYHLTMNRLGAEPARTAFLDDLQANVDAANALGIHGVLVEEDPTGAITRARTLTNL